MNFCCCFSNLSERDIEDEGISDFVFRCVEMVFKCLFEIEISCSYVVVGVVYIDF